MSTAYRPTYHPCVAKANPGGYRFHVASRARSTFDLPAHTVLKRRRAGQNTVEEVAQRDLAVELEMKERLDAKNALQERVRRGDLPALLSASTGVANNDEDDDTGIQQYSAQDFDDEDDSVEESSSGSDSDGDEEDSDDEEAELMRELERIRREREEERQKKADQAEAASRKEVLQRNPLLQMGSDTSSSFAVKRRWDDDVVFRNQARDEPSFSPRFVNDTIRSDFHRRFLNKYIK